MALLEVNNLTKYYKEKLALNAASFNVRKGEFVSVIGRSGAGKSTLLRCINRMIDANDGSVQFADTDLYSLGKRAMRKTRRHVGMIFQHYNLVYRLTVLENVLHGRLGYKSDLDGILGRYTQQEKELAVEMIDKLDLTEQIYNRCDTLSGGQKQRVGIARALVQDPQLILCDEPIASLDPRSAKVIMDHLKKIASKMNIGILCNLHQVDVALKYSDRIIGMKQGEVVFDDVPEKLGKKTIHEIYGTTDGDLIDE